jgi:hypothetical protein
MEGVKGGEYAPSRQNITKIAPKTGGFPHFLVKKSLKMPFFAQKYLFRYTPKMFFEE